MDVKKALTKCMQICSQREYCAYDIEEKLVKWDVAEDAIPEIIKTLCDQKFIDHERYIPAFINDKLNFNHWGKVKIRYFLKQKRLPDTLIKKFIDAIEYTVYHDIMRAEIQKKKRSTTGKSDFDINQKTARYAISKGFEPNLVFEILKMD